MNAGAMDEMAGNFGKLKGEGLLPCEDNFRLPVDGVKDYVDPVGRVMTWNEGVGLIKGYGADEITGEHFSWFHPTESVAAEYPSLQLKTAIERGRFESEGWSVPKDGSRFWANGAITAVRDDKGQLLGFSKVTRDISAREEMEAKLRSLTERLSVATSAANLGVWEWNVASNEVNWDATMFNLYGVEPFQPLTYETWTQAVHPDDRLPTEALLRQIVNEKSSRTFEFRIIRSDSSLRHISAFCRVFSDECDVTRVIGVNTDVTASKSAEAAQRSREAQMIHSIHHDPLTGLPNRALLLERLNRAILLASRNAKKLAVLFLDLDGFKHINDSLGHATGDKLLQSVALRLESSARASDTVSRHSGDEFVVLLSEVETPNDPAVAVERILRAVSEVHFIDQHDLHVTTSIGISLYPDDGLDAKALIKNADTAMYRSKEGGRNTYKFFDAKMTMREVADV